MLQNQISNEASISSDNLRNLLAVLKRINAEQARQLINASFDFESDHTDVSCQLLGAVAATGDLRLTDLLLNAGARVNPKLRHAVEPLWYATANAHVHIVRRLLESGARIEGRSGRNMFLPAIVSGNSELVSLFLEFGADINAEFSGWLSPILLARLLGHNRIVELLHIAGGNLTEDDEQEQRASNYRPRPLAESPSNASISSSKKTSALILHRLMSACQ